MKAIFHNKMSYLPLNLWVPLYNCIPRHFDPERNQK